MSIIKGLKTQATTVAASYGIKKVSGILRKTLGLQDKNRQGGPLSKYAIDCGNNERSDGKEWLVLTEEEAFDLMRTYSTAENIENYFPTYLEEA